MTSIHHALRIDAGASSVYRALVDGPRLAAWWGAPVRWDGAVGSIAALGCTKMRVVLLDADARVEWRCVEGPREWIGTEISFELASTDAATYVEVLHRGWGLDDETFVRCDVEWADRLARLRAVVEAG